MTHTRRLHLGAAAVGAAAIVGGALATAPVASATTQSGTQAAAQSSGATRVYRVQLNELNDSGATGQAVLRVKGTTLSVHLIARGLAPNLVHAQHIHGIGNSECPPNGFDPNGDGVTSTAEGVPFYGPIAASLTTSGDTSPAAGLTIELMPVADAQGRINYKRTFTVDQSIARNLAAFQVVQHGVDLNGNGMYDFSAGSSELNPAFPQEATAPADCGTIEPVHSH